ncbi:hypothetical protein [Pararobbsia silviterrae]|uniref:Uncharacterized protein n=1 Tax=Pararobbsia silviterrae TaxID=1792498 RepID=A0A494XVI9_9BURK|nr:hypothetical protein [Pararobbsia silviterrae]RKP54600.1 hypothetical protein D7S86_13090 [Pararobbsia silviterrae]
MTFARCPAERPTGATGARTRCAAAIALLVTGGCAYDSWTPALSESRQPWRASVHAELGRIYLQGAALEIAEDEARRTLDIDPAHRDALHMVALIALERGDCARAADYFARALATPGARADRALSANAARFQYVRAANCGSAASRAPVASRPSAGAAPARDARATGGAHELNAARSAEPDGSADDLRRAPGETGSARPEIGQLHAQSIAIDNSAASDRNRKQLNDGRTGQSQQATGGTMDRRTRQEYSSEENRDE